MTSLEFPPPPKGYRHRCFFDIEIDEKPVGRIVFELFSDITPITCENFRVLVNGTKKSSNSPEKYLHYKNCSFHRVIDNFMIQSGDFENNDGTGGVSIYGECFEDENFQLNHDRPFLLSMANKGPNTNGSQFFITTNSAVHLDGIHVVFGHVIQGKDVIELIEKQPVDPNSFTPNVDIKIVHCGELIKKSTAQDMAQKKLDVKESSESLEESYESDITSGSSISEAESSDDEVDQVKTHRLASEKYLDKMKLMAKKMNMPLEALGVVPMNPDDIPDTPRNPLLRNNNSLSTKNNRNMPSRSVITNDGKVIKGRGNMRYKPEDKRIQSVVHQKQIYERKRKLSSSDYEPGDESSPEISEPSSDGEFILNRPRSKHPSSRRSRRKNAS